MYFSRLILMKKLSSGSRENEDGNTTSNYSLLILISFNSCILCKSLISQIENFVHFTGRNVCKFWFQILLLGTNFKWAIDSEAMRARGIIVLVKSNYFVKKISRLNIFCKLKLDIILFSAKTLQIWRALFATSGL